MASASDKSRPVFRPKVGLEFGQGGLHTICLADGSVKQNRRAVALGKGGAGSVYPCIYGEHKQRRAVKFLTLNNLDETREGRRQDDFERTFATERAVLSQLSHSNISIFHEDGIHVDEDGFSWHFMVTDHVSGPELKDALSNEKMTGEEIFRTFARLFDAVAYLHRHGVYHCDIKQENIRLRDTGAGAGELVLLDWGAAQVFVSTQARSPVTTLNFAVDSDELRAFISSDHITHERHRPHLKVSRHTSQDLLEFVPSHELHTLGVLLRDMTAPSEEWSQSVRARLGRAIGSQGIVVLDDIIGDLMSAPEGHGYQSVDALVADFAKLHRNYLAPAGVPELGLAAEFQYSIPTATGRAVMTPRFGALTRHRLVHRLHDVHQLESTYLKFPGATHSRLGHSLSVLHNARYYVSHLLNDSRFRRVADREEIEAALLLALLHDIGHFQLSHMFEDLANDQTTRGDSKPWSAIDFDVPTDDTIFAHVLGLPEDMVSNPLRGDYSALVAELVRAKHEAHGAAQIADEPTPLADLISSEFGGDTLRTLATLHATIYGKQKPDMVPDSLRVLAAVISSDIDADKTAYLVEDSQRTGVPYGLGVDLDGILGNLCMPTAADLDRPGTSPMIGLRSAGLQAAQSVAVNRNQMLSQVYWNQANRAVTAMVKYAIVRLLQAGAWDMPRFLEVAMFGSRAETLRWVSSAYESVMTADDVNPLSGILDGAGDVYQRVCEVRSGLVDDADDLNERLLMMSIPQIVSLQDKLSKKLGGMAALRRMRQGELLVDIPSKEREKPSGERGGRVFVYDRFQTTGVGRQLDAVSPLYGGLKDQHKQLNRVSRVFITPKRFDALDQQARDECAKICVSTLREELGL